MQKQADRFREIAAEYGADLIEIEKDGGKVKVGLVAHAIEANLSEIAAELLAVRASTRITAPAGIVRGGDPLDVRTIEASLALAGGVHEKAVAETIPVADRERVMNAATARENRTFGLHRLTGLVIAAAGKHYGGDHKSDGFIKAAFDADREIKADGFATLSLSGVLSNVANKKLLATFQGFRSVVGEIAREVSASDFKQFTSYRVVGSGELTKVGTDGELKDVGLQESSWSNKVETRGGALSLTRQMLDNDDLGAFLALYALFARMAAKSREKVAFTTLLGGLGTLFTAGKANRLSGAGSALGIPGLAAAFKAFRERKAPNGDPVGAMPKLVLVPPALEIPATQYATETRVNEQATSGAPKPGNNPFAGAFPPVTADYISTAFGLSGSSDAGWLLLADPAELAILEIAYLSGQATPIVETGEVDVRQLGIGYRCIYDFGVALGDDLAGVQSVGV